MTTRSKRTARNLQSGLPRKRRQRDVMQSFDALPGHLRQWLSSACLPWSPESALKIWSRAGGASDPGQAIARLDAIERAMLERDAKIWANG